MDFVTLKMRMMDGFRKYKYVCIVLLAGLILMMIPDRHPRETTIDAPQIEDGEQISIEEKLADILSAVNGVGKVKVMLSVDQGERTIYQTDSTFSQGEHNTDSRTQTVLITDADRNEMGLVHQTNPPTYQGAIIIAQGADNPTIKLSIVDAVSKVTGLGADKISVLKMQ